MPYQTTKIRSRKCGYLDSYLRGDQDDKKRKVGYMFMLGSTLVSWSPKKQGIFILFSCEAEYVLASYAACQALG